MCEQSCAALSVLALRKPENSRAIVEGGGAEAALQAMKAHPQDIGVQVRVQAQAMAVSTAPPSPPASTQGRHHAQLSSLNSTTVTSRLPVLHMPPRVTCPGSR